MSDILKSVATVGEAWRASPYYADAEQWTWMFWNPGTPFRLLFDQLDTASVIELACGHGRHAEQIASKAGRLKLMDVHQDNINVCRQRLAKFSNVEYQVNNGYDFQPTEAASLTAIFCYDAMVHFSPDLVASYLTDTARVLKPGGRALYHHSNYPAPAGRHYGQNPHARNHMTKELFGQLAQAAGLRVVEQTVMSWGDVADLDCLSLVERPMP